MACPLCRPSTGPRAGRSWRTTRSQTDHRWRAKNRPVSGAAVIQGGDHVDVTHIGGLPFADLALRRQCVAIMRHASPLSHNTPSCCRKANRPLRLSGARKHCRARRGRDQFSKYPPAKPGALRCEPLKAAYPGGFGAVSHLLRGMRHQVPKLTILKPAHLDAPLFAAA